MFPLARRHSKLLATLEDGRLRISLVSGIDEALDTTGLPLS